MPAGERRRQQPGVRRRSGSRARPGRARRRPHPSGRAPPARRRGRSRSRRSARHRPRHRPAEASSAASASAGLAVGEQRAAGERAHPRAETRRRSRLRARRGRLRRRRSSRPRCRRRRRGSAGPQPLEPAGARDPLLGQRARLGGIGSRGSRGRPRSPARLAARSGIGAGARRAVAQLGRHRADRRGRSARGRPASAEREEQGQHGSSLQMAASVRRSKAISCSRLTAGGRRP